MRATFKGMSILGAGLGAAALCVSSAFATSAEFSKETRALADATAAFFDRVEATARPSKRAPYIGMPRTVTPAATSATEATHADLLTQKGAVDHLTGYRVTWYPVDRLLGTVDFMGTWDGNRNLVCGYLTWDLSTPDTPRLASATANFVDLTDLRAATAREVHMTLLEANCAFGELDANFHYFDVGG
ncbi:MAG: hypothetical protein AAFR73_00215 [Pseudomonadota bacterium]